MDLRCFIAIELSPELKETLRGLTRRLGASGTGVRWTPEENIHLTLKFLGKTPEGLMPEIEAKLAGAAAGCGGFDLAFRGVQGFPDLRRPKVIWVGAGDPPVLMRLQADMERAMESLGYPLEKRAFTPHLTLGRVKDGKGLGAALRDELASLAETDFGLLRVETVSLIRSMLNPAGATYMRLLSVGLGN